jgi:hypothetical protein
MFGGFDGDFFDDLTVLNLVNDVVSNTAILPSSFDRDFLSLLDSPSDYDIVFRVHDVFGFQDVKASKALVLYRAVEKERSVKSIVASKNINAQLQQVVMEEETPEFLKRVFRLEH